ncbi:phosphoribosylglycinamide formyltransferase [Lampropedia aestuarii]|uniref:Phosphoribosylglycinamide formyltransferase n=1 Tax=Lampropedia aestuarii TaxID=2562762 RepID=A0A4S5BQZ7_9BURK|nr:phosphoribosylglycinamide formyltransferase [Lampropedia aestuarii]THJ32258.1 phosphoribosylglycinamide formyltransferase [Lampropedia aestuarii]
MKNIVVLISGTGSNMAALVQAQQQRQWQAKWGARITAVISNRPDAPGLHWAKAHGLATQVVDHKQYASREDFDCALAQALEQYQPSLVILAGFMRVLTEGFVRQFEQRLVNIHPSLLPAFAGLHTHQRAIDAGCKVAGATVHWVIPELDAGPIIDQAVVPVLAGDTADSLASRVRAQEHLLYPRAIECILARQAAQSHA